MQVGRVTAQCGVKDGVSEGVTLLGTPTSLHTVVLTSAVCLLHAAGSLGRMEGEAAVCKEGEPQLPREGGLHTGAPLQQRAGSSWWETLHDVLT